MQDGFGRTIDYLRISVTDRCNLRCRYCMPNGIETLSMKEILTYEEIACVVKEAAMLGIDRLKITGGEPLVRRGIIDLIRMLKAIPGIRQVTLTTNGILLKDMLDDLIMAGTDGINISLDTTDRESYLRITGSDKLADVLEGFEAALKSGIPIKLNAVSVDWDGKRTQALELLNVAKDHKADVRFIELMPIGLGRQFPGIPHDVLIPFIKEMHPDMVPDPARHGNGPAVYYQIPGFLGSIGFISAIHGVFCGGCNRIRLTAQGYLKSCLCYEAGTDLRDILRGGMSAEAKREAIREGIRSAILCKPKSHAFSEPEKISEKNVMSAIGG